MPGGSGDLHWHPVTSCPNNKSETQERSTAINCTEKEFYMCLPSENFTKLMEFCYHAHIGTTPGKKLK